MTNLVMFSGGIDSTALLLHVLRDTEEPVIVHHIRLRNTDRRDGAEWASARMILPYLRDRYREFEFTTSLVDVTNSYNTWWSGSTVIYMAVGIMVARRDVVRLSIGWCAEDGPWDEMWRAYFEWAMYLTRTSAQEIFNYVRDDPEVYAPFAAKTKTELLDDIGPELAAMTWGCRTPVHLDDGGFEECGRCFRCEELIPARKRWAEKNGYACDALRRIG